MHVSLPIGPFTLPTAPLLAMLAAIVCLEVAARAGRRFGLRANDVWNTGLYALLAGLIVARLWNVIQFRDVYSSDLLLIISPRPSGFALLPGVVAALVVGYANLIRRALDPVPVLAAYAVGIAAAGVIMNVSAYLTGEIVGVASTDAWAVRYFFEMVHPVALYRALGMALVFLVAWFTLRQDRPARTLWLVVLGYGLVILICDAWAREPALVGPLRQTQLLGFVLSVGASLALAREAARVADPAPEPLPAQPVSAQPVSAQPVSAQPDALALDGTSEADA